MFQHLDTFKSRSWFKKKKKAIYLNSLHGRQVYESQWKSIQNETFLPVSFWKRCIDKAVNWFSMESFSVLFIIIQLCVFSVHCNAPSSFQTVHFLWNIYNKWHYFAIFQQFIFYKFDFSVPNGYVFSVSSIALRFYKKFVVSKFQEIIDSFQSPAQNILVVIIFQTGFQYATSEVVAHFLSKNPMGIIPGTCVSPFACSSPIRVNDN